MFVWQSFLIGLLSGVVATLIAGNPHVRFHIEKVIRKVLKKPLVSVWLTSFTNFCNDGIFLTHCIKLKNNMWLTPQIPRVYFLSRGTFDYDAHAYKPFLYFRSCGVDEFRLDSTLTQLFKKYSNKIIPYSPDNPSLSVNISRGVPISVAVICESIPSKRVAKKGPLNQLGTVGELHAAVANPMPTVSLGARWDMIIISEDFGLIDRLHITIPEDLEEQEPLGDTVEVFQMTERPACLLDIDYCGFTWPLRFKVNNREIRIKKKDYSHKGEIRIQ